LCTEVLVNVSALSTSKGSQAPVALFTTSVSPLVKDAWYECCPAPTVLGTWPSRLCGEFRPLTSVVAESPRATSPVQFALAK
jgi:hypothetical protein